MLRTPCTSRTSDEVQPESAKSAKLARPIAGDYKSSTARERGAHRVTLENGHQILTPVAAGMMLRKILVLTGDRVSVDLSRYDLYRQQ